MTTQQRTTTNITNLLLQHQPPSVQENITPHNKQYHILIARIIKRKKKNYQTSSKISKQIKTYQDQIDRSMNRISSFTKFKKNYNTNNNIQKSRRYSTPCIQPRIDQDQMSQSILNPLGSLQQMDHKVDHFLK